MRKIKLGLIGTGLAFDKLHYPALVRLTDKFEIAAICETDEVKAKEAAAKIGLATDSVYSSCDEMLKKADVEAVDTMVPIGKNFETAKAVITAGKHLIAEKPFAATPEEASELIRLAKKNKTKVLVAENFRYSEENILIKDIIVQKRIGNVTYFIDNNVTEFQKEMLGDSFPSTEWRQHPDFKGGIFLDSAVHHIGRQRFLFGDVRKLFATGRRSEVDFCPYSCINALLTFDDDGNQIAGHYAFFCIAKETQSPKVGLRIFGTAGEIFLEEKECGFVNVSYKDGGHEAIPYKPGEGYYNELLNFYNAIENGEKIIASPEKELGDIQVVFDILRSAEKYSAVASKNNYRTLRGASARR